MWGTFLSEPLRIVGTVVRYTAVCLMRRMPIPCRCLSFLPGGCPPGIYAGLASLSEGCPPAGGRLHTCYSPVRQSPAGSASTSPVALRLACVKPAASVHPEPGSNSPLFILFSFFSFKDDFRNLRSRRSDSNISNCCLWPSLSFCIVRSGIAGLLVPCTLTTFTLLVLWQNVIVLLLSLGVSSPGLRLQN